MPKDETLTPSRRAMLTYWDRIATINKDQATVLVDFGKAVLDIDGHRADIVDQKAQWVLTLSLATIGLMATGAGVTRANSLPVTAWPLVLGISSGLALVLAGGSVLRAMWARAVWKQPSPHVVLCEPIEEQQDALALRKRIAVHYFQIFEENSATTEGRGVLVKDAQWFLALGIALGAAAAAVVIASMPLAPT
jgi:hypothetical protein